MIGVELNEFEKKLVTALADNDMNESEVAREFYMHRNTVIYHLEKLKQKTGIDPRSFYGLMELVQMAR